MRQDTHKKFVNRAFRSDLKKITREAKENPSPELLRKAVSALDKALKRGLIHKNAVNRKKSSLAKVLQSKSKKTSKIPRKDIIKS